MKLISVAVTATLLQTALGHYFWDKLILDGVETRSNEYVRRTTRKTAYNPIKWIDTRDDSTPDLDDIRCNQGHFASAGSTKVATVSAGSKVGFKLAVGATMQHPGPALAYMSRAPNDNVQAYRGDGDWYKIWETGICFQDRPMTNTAWCTWDMNKVEFNIPKDTPDGEYLLRVEHIGEHVAHISDPEFYPACAHIKVINGGTGNPGPMVKFPGAYKQTDPAFNRFSIYNGMRAFPMPGPAIWSGGNAGGSTQPSSSRAASSSAAPATSSPRPAASSAAPPSSSLRPVTSSVGAIPSSPLPPNSSIRTFSSTAAAVTTSAPATTIQTSVVTTTRAPATGTQSATTRTRRTRPTRPARPNHPHHPHGPHHPRPVRPVSPGTAPTKVPCSKGKKPAAAVDY